MEEDSEVTRFQSTRGATMMKVQSSKVRDLFAREKERTHGGTHASGRRVPRR